MDISELDIKTELGDVVRSKIDLAGSQILY